MKVLIVGAGLGALRTAESLRTHNYRDEITIVGEEPHFPYNRPPLSKSSLSEKLDHAQLEFKRSENIVDVNWIFSDSAVTIEMESQHIVLESGRHENFDYLVAATGIRPRHLTIPGSEKERFTLRNLDHSSTLFAEISKSKKIIIVGAGFVGCEMAATVRSQGIEVVVVAADPEPMFLPLGEKLGAAMRERHELHGVTFLMNATIQSFIGDHRARGVSLANGLEINGDLVLEAVGSVPNTEWLHGAGIDLSNGVLVDENMHAKSKDNVPIFAVGDIARYRFDLFDEEPHRIEHWNLPTESGRRAGESIARLCAGLPLLNPPVEFIPAFWSDQYEYRIQSFGMPHLADRREVVAGEVNGPCVVEYLREDEIVGVVGIDSTPQLIKYRKEFSARGIGAN